MYDRNINNSSHKLMNRTNYFSRSVEFQLSSNIMSENFGSFEFDERTIILDLLFDYSSKTITL